MFFYKNDRIEVNTNHILMMLELLLALKFN